jgi:hypothetical protein
MPVSRQDFERGATTGSTESKILEFLTQNAQNAYTPDEIAAAIGHTTTVPLHAGASEIDRIARGLEKAAFVSQLGLMVLTRKISSRLVQTLHGPMVYFASKRAR